MPADHGRVLVVDDELINRTLISTDLQEAGFQVSLAENGEDALMGLRAQPFDVVLLDLNMPGLDGSEVLRRMKEDPELRHIPVIVLAAIEEMDKVVECVKMGATDHLAKPFNAVLLHARITAALASKRLHDQQETYRRELERRVWEKTQDVQRSYEQLQQTLDGTVFALSSVVEMRDPYTAGHQQRVTVLSCAIAEEMGLPDDQIEGIRVTGLLHDIGKICVPAEILSKPGRIAETEFNIIKGHPRVGHDILKNINFPWPVAQVVLQHHEALDGTGYPLGLEADDILLESRIIAVADVVEAMSTHRPYRPSLGVDKAIEELTSKRAKRFDAAVVDACLELCKKGKLELGA